jgi:hypothetical protein
MKSQKLLHKGSCVSGTMNLNVTGSFHFEVIRQTTTILKISWELNYFKIKIPFASRYLNCRLLPDIATNIL